MTTNTQSNKCVRRGLSGLCGVGVFLVACLFLFAPQAQAKTLYRCTGAGGETVYGSNTKGMRNCVKMHVDHSLAKSKSTKPKRSSKPRAASPAAPKQSSGKGKVVFRTGTAAKPPKLPKAKRGSRTVRGAVYRVERDGIVHYTNVKPKGKAGVNVLFTYIETCYACGAKPGVDFGKISLNMKSYRDEVARAAAQHGVDEALVRAVIHAESAFRPNAKSHAGAQGLMQLIPATAKRFGVRDVYVPEQNIQGGTKYLAWLLKRFDGNVRLAAAGYNAGEGAVDKYGGVPPYNETQLYVERVGTLHARYRAALGQ